MAGSVEIKSTSESTKQQMLDNLDASQSTSGIVSSPCIDGQNNPVDCPKPELGRFDVCSNIAGEQQHTPIGMTNSASVYNTPAPALCQGADVSWNVLTTTCSGYLPSAGSGKNSRASDTSAPNTGYAIFLCEPISLTWTPISKVCTPPLSSMLAGVQYDGSGNCVHSILF